MFNSFKMNQDMTLLQVFGNYFTPSLSTKCRSSWLLTGFSTWPSHRHLKFNMIKACYQKTLSILCPLPQRVELCHLIAKCERWASPSLSNPHPINASIQSVYLLRRYGSKQWDGMWQCIKQTTFHTHKELTFQWEAENKHNK